MCDKFPDKYNFTLGLLKSENHAVATVILMDGYDIIGDIHGYASILKMLLTELGYSRVDGVWRHPKRKVIFVGDFVNRGPEIRETLALVRGMVESGQALAILGNHE